MFIEEQDDDVEEEEEFHEVEEEKHRTSQESVPDSCVTPNPSANMQPTKSPEHKSSTSDVVSSPAETTTSATEETQPHDSTTAYNSTTQDEPTMLHSNSNTAHQSTTLQNETHSDIQLSVEVPKIEQENTTTVESPKLNSPITVVENHDTLDDSTTEQHSGSSKNSPPSDTSATLDTSNTPEKPTSLDTSTTLDQAPDTDEKPAEETPENNSTTIISEAIVELAGNSIAHADKEQSEPDSAQGNIHTDETKSDEIKKSKDLLDASDWANIMLLNENSAALSDKTLENNESDVKQNNEEGEKKELDLDEDVKNPQYIPKKGVFYEHDDRSHDDNSKKITGTPTKKDDESNEPKEISGSKKGVAQTEKQVDSKKGNRRQRTDADRWNHDLFRDTRQKPKSKSELITAYGYDIRSERTPRMNTQVEGRQPRAGNSGNNADRTNNHDNQKLRQIKDNRGSGGGGRHNQTSTSNRSRERRSRRGPNVRNNSRTQNSTPLNSSSTPRNEQSIRSLNAEVKHDTTDSKQTFPTPQPSTTQPPSRIENSTNQRGSRFEGRTRRQSSRDRPISNSMEDSLPPLTTVMPPITTWSNKIEDMVKEEADRRESPSRHLSASSTNSRNRTTSNEYWPQNHQQNKSSYIDRGSKNFDDKRQQSVYSNRARHGTREESHKMPQFSTRNQFNDNRANQQNPDWRRTTNYNNSYGKPTEFEPIKTQTFENSKLSQASTNRPNYRDQRDAREIINERRMLNQQQQEQNYQSKIHPTISDREFHLQHQQQIPQRNQIQQQQHPNHLHDQQEPLHQIQPIHSHHHHQYQHQHLSQQHNSNHLRHQQRNHATQLTSQHSPQTHSSRDQQHPPTQPMVQQQQQHQQQQQQQQQLPPPRASQHQPPSQLQHVNPSRQNPTNNSVVDNLHESNRLNVGPGVVATTDIINNNSRPIIKTDSYTNAPQQTTLPQHSHNHLTGPISQTSGTATTHIVPSHLGTGSTQAQYYSPTGNSRDSAAAAAIASAYHGYMAGGHSVLDTSRYHLTSQLSDHGYIAPADPAGDVPSAARVMHQQGMYGEPATAGNAVPGSAYMAQTAPNLSPSTNIPVTGAGPPPLTPVSYLQHSQYHPPYTNPYSHPQHNHQAPPQSSHAYPYWTYI